MKIIFTVIFLLLALENNFANAEANKAYIDAIENKIDLCMLNNQYNLNYIENCLTIADQALTETQQQSQLLWEYAGMIRRKLGNIFSLKYYNLALQDKVTPERCIDEGLDAAIKSGLDLPATQSPHEVRVAQEIVFNHCWAEFKDEIIAVSKDRPSSIWHDNVCTGVQSIKAKTLFPECP